MKTIKSKSNSLIKFLFNLNRQSRLRKEKGLFIVEELTSLKIALSCGYEIQDLLIEENLKEEVLNQLKNKIDDDKIILSDMDVLNKIAYKNLSSGVIAILKVKNHGLRNLDKIKANCLIGIGDSIEKPGNIGAIMRTADAAGIDALILSNLKTDLYNPNVIRSSLGTVFSNNIIVCPDEDAIKWLEKNNVKICSTIVDAKNEYDKINYSGSVAIVVGSEKDGLSSIWRNKNVNPIRINMRGMADSLNVSVSFAIVIFEALKQKMK